MLVVGSLVKRFSYYVHHQTRQLTNPPTNRRTSSAENLTGSAVKSRYAWYKSMSFHWTDISFGWMPLGVTITCHRPSRGIFAARIAVMFAISSLILTYPHLAWCPSHQFSVHQIELDSYLHKWNLKPVRQWAGATQSESLNQCMSSDVVGLAWPGLGLVVSLY